MLNMEKRRKNKGITKERLGEIIAVSLLLAAIAAFAVWSFTADGLSPAGIIVSAMALTLLTVSSALAVPKAVNFFRGYQTEKLSVAGERSARARLMHPIVYVILAALFARILLYIAAYLIDMALNGYQGTIFYELERIWLKADTDAPHYFSIAENWYTTELPQGQNIVFMPLFPLAIRAFNLIFRSSFVSATVINTLCSCGSAAVIYELALCDMGRRTSKVAVVFTFILPAAIFYAAPMSEAMFLLLSSAALLMLRKERFVFASIFVALASFTRSLGIILLVPYVAEAVAYIARFWRTWGREVLSRQLTRVILGFVLCFAGMFAYLLINRLIWGDWFKFLDFQQNSWYQRPTFFLNTISMQTGYLFATFGSNNAAALGLWLPNLLYIFGALLVFIASARTLHSSYSLYFIAYFAVTCGASWLLSGPRYLTALVVIPLALARLCESRDDGIGLARARAKTAAVTVILLVCQAFYLLMYILRYNIY